jgi:hypothetical protein
VKRPLATFRLGEGHIHHERHSKRGEALDFGHRVGGTLFIPAFLTHGLHGLTFRGEAICKLRRCTENKESPGIRRGFECGTNIILEGGNNL